MSNSPATFNETGGSSYAQVRRASDFTAAVRSDDSSWTTFRTTGFTVSPLDIDKDPGTPTLASTRFPESHFDLSTPPREPQFGVSTDKATREARTRVELLVRRSLSELNAEEEARLVIATQRLRKLLPHVTAADFENLADATERIQAIGKETDELRAELGL